MSARKSDHPLSPDTLAALLEAVQPAELGVERRDRMRDRMLRAARDAAPSGTSTIRDSAAQWTQLAPYVEVRELSRDERAGVHVSLLRMRPGGVIEAHRHSKDEEFIVLEGECHIGTHCLRSGDIHRAAAGSLHERITTNTGVLVLVRGEYPYPAGA